MVGAMGADERKDGGDLVFRTHSNPYSRDCDQPC